MDSLNQQKLKDIIELLQIAQSHIGPMRPDDFEDEPEDQAHWDRLDDGIEYIEQLLGNEAPYLVRVRQPFWADESNTLPGAMFFFGGYLNSTATGRTSSGDPSLQRTGVNVVAASDAFEFQTLAAAELTAVQMGGTVFPFLTLVKQLRADFARGDKYAIETLNAMLPRHGESL